MKCAIMQPTFLPWSGYFQLMKHVDIFVFLDDAQFQKNSWHNRNRIALNNSAHWLTVPIHHQSLEQTLLATCISEKTLWREKMVRLLTQNYAKHPFYYELIEFIKLITNNHFTSLAELNIALITMMANKLDLKCNILRSSEIGIQGVRTQRLLSILQELNIKEYISPQGAREYLTLDGFSTKTNIPLYFQEFEPQLYSQKNTTSFITRLSMLDIVMNIGWNASKNYITK